MDSKRKNILLIVPHMPAFDSCMPLMIRLHQRGKVDVKIIINHRLIKIDARLEHALKASGVPYEVKSLLWIELFSWLQIARSDFMLTHSDPVAYGGKFRPRDHFMKILKKNVVFIQHGMVQQGLQTKGVLRDVWDFYSQTLLIWADLPNAAASFLAPDVADRMHVTGITKTNLLSSWPNQDRLAAELSKFSRRVLICHNFGFEKERYTDQMFEKALRVWKAAAQSRPDIAFILRSHRGKRRRNVEQKIAKMCKDCPNIIRSERHYGIMAMATINDVMALVDCVISHPSTTILDAVYEGKPVAVMNSFQRIFECLPNVDNLDNFTRFVEDCRSHAPNTALRGIYGNVSDNLDKAASIVEQQMNNTEI